MVGVITNGSAVLGLGDIGPLAAKPVMEGKAVLFKRFANIDAFDIEVDAKDPEQFIAAVSRLEPTFGAINLEDIKAPDCFIIESALSEQLNIPVFHDDQHGTAIVVAAAIKNGLELVDKQLADIKLVSTGGGAASLSCLDLLVELGLPRENVTLVDLARRRLCRTGRRHERLQGTLCEGYAREKPRRRDCRRRCVPGPVCAERLVRGYGEGRWRRTH